MKIIIEPYNADWSKQFALESEGILNALPNLKPIVHHIGSTSVTELSAKPIIDIMIGLNSLEELNMIIPSMQSLGYSYVSRYEVQMPYRRYFVRYCIPKGLEYVPVVDSATQNMAEAGYESLVHVHSVVIDSEFWERHLAFRDYLREYPNERDKYGEFKLSLSELEWESGLDYSAAKHDFIQEMQRKALEWYRQNRR